MADVVMPQLGETVTEGTITKWFKQVGDVVRVDEPLFEVSTDKVDTEVPSPVSGVVSEIRAAFERARSIEYSIQSISGKDLEVTKDNDKVVVSFAYDKEIELFGPVSLLIKYRGRSQ